jgi:hypothetical protein
MLAPTDRREPAAGGRRPGDVQDQTRRTVPLRSSMPLARGDSYPQAPGSRHAGQRRSPGPSSNWTARPVLLRATQCVRGDQHPLERTAPTPSCSRPGRCSNPAFVPAPPGVRGRRLQLMGDTVAFGQSARLSAPRVRQLAIRSAETAVALAVVAIQGRWTDRRGARGLDGWRAPVGLSGMPESVGWFQPCPMVGGMWTARSCPPWTSSVSVA